MRLVSRLMLGAGALVALGGAALVADPVHVLNVAMPDGSVARIRYVGNVPPRVVAVPAMQPMMSPVAFFGPDSPFAAMDRMAAEMDRQADAMFRRAALLAAAPADAGQATTRLPAGTVSYSMVSLSSGNGATCSRSVQVTALHPGEAPKVVQQSRGDCSAMTRGPTAAVARAAPAQPQLTPARYALDHPKPVAKPVI